MGRQGSPLIGVRQLFYTARAFATVVASLSDTFPLSSALQSSAHAYRPDSNTWRALSYFNLHRVFLATLFTGLMLSPARDELFEPRSPEFAQGAALVYLGLVVLSLLLRGWRSVGFLFQVSYALCVDITMLTLLMNSLGGVTTGIGILLVITIGGGALLLPGRLAIGFAALASLAVLLENAHGILYLDRSFGNTTQAGLLGAAYFGTAILGYALARRARESQALAEKRGVDLANLAQLNELIIQRMRTGILVVDRGDGVRLMNESAWYLMGMPNPNLRDLGRLSPELLERLELWRREREHLPHPLRLSTGVPAVAPRFMALGEDDGDTATVVFLEDTSVVSKRAEELNLTSLGQLAGSIAHEIRNPLSAISHAEQLLLESDRLEESDRRLLEIIHTQSRRMNTIVENVLQISRRERSRPEPLRLAEWLPQFVSEFRAASRVDEGELRYQLETDELEVNVDPSHLNQVLWNLCQNALRYGHRADEPARVVLRCGHAEPGGGVVLDVVDAGPGIDPESASRIFQPFYTSDARGSGLGLYIARQLVEANQASLEYLPVPTGGSCFRITFPRPRQALTEL